MKTLFNLRDCKRVTLCCAKLLLAAFVLISLSGEKDRIFAQRPTPKSANQEQIFEAEKLLSNLGYWITKADRTADASTRHALVAFQKVEGRRRTGVLNDSELKALRAAVRPSPKFDGEAHIEIDIGRQVLFLVDASGVITHVLPVSTGNEGKYYDQGKWQKAHTPRGTFRITRQIKGVRRSTLGELYNPNYFTGGVAIHGSNSIPTTPASHGCVRIPRFADKEFQSLVWIRMVVNVYD